jgi:hypothetical protein
VFGGLRRGHEGHCDDLAAGCGSVYLSYALDRKEFYFE